MSGRREDKNEKALTKRVFLCFSCGFVKALEDFAKVLKTESGETKKFCMSCMQRITTQSDLTTREKYLLKAEAINSDDIIFLRMNSVKFI